MTKTRESIITPLGLPVPVNLSDFPYGPRSVLPHYVRPEKTDTELTPLALEKRQIANMEIGGCRIYVQDVAILD